MVYSGTYALLLSAHLLAVVIVIGSLGYLTATAGRLARDGDARALRRTATQVRALSLGSLLVVVLGWLMLEREPTRLEGGAAWVAVSFVLWFVAVGLNLGLVGPALTAAATDAEAGTPTTSYAAKLGAFGGISTLCWVVIVVLMVYKPGA